MSNSSKGAQKEYQTDKKTQEEGLPKNKVDKTSKQMLKFQILNNS